MPHSPGWRRRDRRTDQPSRLGEVLDGLLREPALAGGVSVGRLASCWGDVVGPRLARETAPVGLEGGVLIVAATDGPWGAQARFLAEEIRRQANAALGEEAVRAVRVVVRPESWKSL